MRDTDAANAGGSHSEITTQDVGLWGEKRIFASVPKQMDRCVRRPWREMQPDEDKTQPETHDKIKPNLRPTLENLGIQPYEGLTRREEHWQLRCHIFLLV